MPGGDWLAGICQSNTLTLTLTLTLALTLMLTLALCALQEFYGDFVAVNPHLFSLNLPAVSRVSLLHRFPSSFVAS